MMTTGHQTEASFNHYLGIDGPELLAWYRRTVRKRVANAPISWISLEYFKFNKAH